MSAAAGLVVAGVWIVVAVLVGVAVSRIVRHRDYEVDATVEAEMAGVDAEYERLVKDGGR